MSSGDLLRNAGEKLIEIVPIKELNAEISVPGSKYLANRALIIAALADGKSVLKQVPDNQDINDAIKVLSGLGIRIIRDKDAIHVFGQGGIFRQCDIDVGDSGTLMRFATALSSLVPGRMVVTGGDRIKERPISPLLDSLAKLGVTCKSLNNGFPPVEIYGPSLIGGKTTIAGDISSQFVSSILIVAPYAKKDVEITVEKGLVSRNYVDMTIDLMSEFGVLADRVGYSKFSVKKGQRYAPKEFNITGDWSSASYFFGAAAILNGSIKIDNLNMNTKQGEASFTDLLVKMGCMSRKTKKYLQVVCLGNLNAIDVDMSQMPDVVQTLAVVACFAKGTTTIRNISQLKDKESNRIVDTVAELKKFGIVAACTEDSITIEGGEVKPAIIDPHNDHRMAMSFALAGLKVPGIKIKNPDCVKKSFPRFWEKFQEIGAGIRYV